MSLREDRKICSDKFLENQSLIRIALEITKRLLKNSTLVIEHCKPYKIL